MQGWVLDLAWKNWILERAMGIEPTSEAWEASILPLYDARSFPQRADYTQPTDSPYRPAIFDILQCPAGKRARTSSRAISPPHLLFLRTVTNPATPRCRSVMTRTLNTLSVSPH